MNQTPDRSPLRVVVVEDSASVREHLVATLRRSAAFDVVGVAADGKRAVELIESLRPDVVSMDMMLPIMSGLAATEYVMAFRPTPILIVSASTNRGELFRTYDALAAGAVDVLEKPTGSEALAEWDARYVATLRRVARIKVITHTRGRLRARLGHLPDSRPTIARTAADVAMDEPFTTPALVAIGASTGGPGAVLEVVRNLPTSFDVPIAFVLHIGKPFSDSFADWFDGQVDRRVMFATDGLPIGNARGAVVMAPPDRHLRVRHGRFLLDDGPARHSCRPSCDVLFESVADEYGSRAIGCLLTGMGRDGAAGLAAMRRRGAPTIAQDEATSVVFGMPREAIALGGASEVVPLPDIAGTLVRLARSVS